MSQVLVRAQGRGHRFSQSLQWKRGTGHWRQDSIVRRPRGDLPVTGDWDGSGHTKIGIYRPSTGEWFLDIDGDGVLDPARDRPSKFGGAPGDRPVTGDWNGSGKDHIGIVHADYQWMLDLNGDGRFDPGTDTLFYFGGLRGDVPLTGDWSGSGSTKPGIFREGSWLLDFDDNRKFRETPSSSDALVEFGKEWDVPVTGVW